jgi:pilus assembly protein CpaE
MMAHPSPQFVVSTPPLQKIPALAVLARSPLTEALKSICVELTDLSGVSPTEIALRHGGRLMLIEQGVEGCDQLLLTLAVERPSTAVIIVSDHLPGHMVRALMKLEASDVLPADAALDDIAASAMRLLEARGDQQPSHSAMCWVFRGAVGGAGVSTLAIEAAFDLNRRLGPGRVCLIDLNVADGMVTSFLDCVPKLDLEALSAMPERLDQHLLSAWCHEHESGLKLIAAKRNPDADMLANENAVLRLLDVSCGAFDFVIVDLPRHMMPWTKAVMAAADEAIIISELTVPSLHAAADMCRDVDIWRGERVPAKLVLNRMFPKKRFRSEFDVARAEKAIERTIDATVASDWDAARTAVNLGKPIADVKPKSQLVADMARIVGGWLPTEAVTAPVLVQKKRARR